MTQADIYPDFLNLQYTEDIVNMNMYLNIIQIQTLLNMVVYYQPGNFYIKYSCGETNSSRIVLYSLLKLNLEISLQLVHRINVQLSFMNLQI